MATASSSARVAWLALVATIAVAAGCATTESGRAYSETRGDGAERVDGIEFDSIGSALQLSQHPWVPQLVIVRRSANGKATGNSIFAVVVVVDQPFGFERLVANGPAGERTFPGTVTYVKDRFSFAGSRYFETSEVALTDDDVRWLADAGEALDLRADGTRWWFKFPPGAALAAALRKYYETYVVDGAAAAAN